MINIERSEETLGLRESEKLGRLPEFKLYYGGIGIKFEETINADKLTKWAVAKSVMPSKLIKNHE